MDFELIYMVPHAAIGAFFILSIFPYIGENYRAKFQFFAHSLFAFLLLFVPTIFLKPTVKGEQGALHGFLQSFCSAVHVGQAFLLWNCRGFGKPEQSIILSRAVAALLALFTRCFALFHMNEKSTKGLPITENFLYCVLLTDGLWFVTEVIRMYLNRRSKQDEIDEMVKRTTFWVEGRGSFFAENAFFVDAGMTIIYGMICFAFPTNVLKIVLRNTLKLDSHHYMWCRMFGALNMMPAVSSIAARHFSPELQTAYMASRLLTQCIVFLLNIYGHWVLSCYSANHISAFMICGFFSSFLFSIYHRMLREYFKEKEPSLSENKRKSVKKSNSSDKED